MVSSGCMVTTFLVIMSPRRTQRGVSDSRSSPPPLTSRRSLSETSPTRRPSSTTGTWRMLCSLHTAHASAALASGPSVTTSRVMESLTLSMRSLLFSAVAILSFDGAYHPVLTVAVVASEPLEQTARRIGYEGLAGATIGRTGAGTEARGRGG